MKILVSFYVIFFTSFISVYGQINNSGNAIGKEKISISFGTFTNELALKNKLFKKMYSSFGFGYSNYTLKNDFKFNDNLTTFKLNSEVISYKASIEYVPNNNLNLGIFIGLAYFPIFNLNAEGALKDSIKFGDLYLKPDITGKIFAKVNYSGFSPFGGIAYHTFLSNRFSFESKLTINYFTNPVVEQYGGTSIFNYNNQNINQFQNLISQYKILPSLNFGFNYLIK